MNTTKCPTHGTVKPIKEDGKAICPQCGYLITTDKW